jgi:hypothetical protein
VAFSGFGAFALVFIFWEVYAVGFMWWNPESDLLPTHLFEQMNFKEPFVMCVY